MAAPDDPVLAHVRRLADADAADGLLLRRYLDRRDEAAFAALVRRHGPAVLGVGRRVAGPADADDVFQAAFLLLARRAHRIRRAESVGPWLHGAAYRLALKARTRAARRRASEAQAAARRPAPSAESAWRELGEILDAAMHGLPERYRSVLLLCYSEGKTQEEAARRLGIPLGTVRSRLARGRDLLK